MYLCHTQLPWYSKDAILKNRDTQNRKTQNRNTQNRKTQNRNAQNRNNPNPHILWYSKSTILNIHDSQ